MTKAENPIPRLIDLDPATMTDEQLKLADIKLEYQAAHQQYWHIYDTLGFRTTQDRARAWAKVDELENAVSEMGLQIGVNPWIGGLD